MKKILFTQLLFVAGLVMSAASFGQNITPASGTYCPYISYPFAIDNAPAGYSWAWSNGSSGTSAYYTFDESQGNFIVTVQGTKSTTTVTTSTSGCTSYTVKTKDANGNPASYNCTVVSTLNASATAIMYLRPTMPIISGLKDVPCGSTLSLTYSVSADPEVSKYTWGYSPWSAVSNSTSSSITLNTTTTGAPTISVQGQSKNCSNLVSPVATYPINRKPLAPTLDAANSPTPGTIVRSSTAEYKFTVTPPAGATSFSWACIRPLQGRLGSGSSTGPSTNWIFPQAGKGTILVTPNSACGAGATATINFDVICPQPDASVFSFCTPTIPGNVSNVYNPATGWADANQFPRYVIDINHDEFDDIVGITSGGVVASINNKTGGFLPGIPVSLEFGQSVWTDNNIFPRMLVDMNNDQYPDIVGFASGGIVVALNKKLAGATAAFFPSTVWYPGQFGTSSGWANNNVYPRTIEDVDGDGWNDIVGFHTAGVAVSLNKGSSISPGLKPASLWCGNQFGVSQGWSDNGTFPRRVIDMNNDGAADIVGFSGFGVVVALSNKTATTLGTAFKTPGVWVNDFGTLTPLSYTNAMVHPRAVVDVNKDGYPDIIGLNYGVRVALNDKTGSAFAPASLWLNEFSVDAPGLQPWANYDVAPRLIGDINGDSLPDIVGFNQNVIMVSLNEGGLSYKCPSYTSVKGFTGAWGFTSQSVFPRYLVNMDGPTEKNRELLGFGPTGVNVMSCNNGTNFREEAMQESLDNANVISEKLICYPNPFTNNLTIEYKANDASEVTVSIFNSIGGKVKELKRTTGENAFSFSGETLENGTYFCILYENGKITAKKSIVLQK